ncbi:hypothetical protein [Vallicoccus soli]|nr:hypothetical protein [Vallicoccus soli]
MSQPTYGGDPGETDPDDGAYRDHGSLSPQAEGGSVDADADPAEDGAEPT